MIFALTLTSMFFIYAVMASVFWLILLINVSRFKKDVSSYLLTDSVFIIFISLFYIPFLVTIVEVWKGMSTSQF